MIPAPRLAALLLVLAPGMLAAQTPDYLAQLKRKAAEWDKIVGQVQGTVEWKVDSVSENRKTKHTFTDTLKQNATSMLMIEHQQREGDPGSKNAFGYNATYGFELLEENGKWRLAGQKVGKPNQIVYGRMSLPKAVVNRLSINYPPHLFDEQKTRLEKTEVVRKGKQNLFSVRFTNVARIDLPDEAHTNKGVAYFDIDLGLSLVYQESESILNESGLRKTLSKITTEYEGKLGKFPRPKRRVAELKSDGGEMDGKSTSRSVTTYNLRLDAKAPDREFTLSAFGLPEPAKEKKDAK